MIQPLLNLSDTDDSAAQLDWIEDLQRILLLRSSNSCPHAPAPDDSPHFMVYTWYLDHHRAKICMRPKIVTLDDDPHTWEDTILQSWRHHITQDEKVLIDNVSPTPPRSSVETHVAHLILTQHAVTLRSVLLTVDFHEVITRFAICVPDAPAWEDFSQHIPLLTPVVPAQIEWIVPDKDPSVRPSTIWHGKGFQVKIHDEPEDTALTDITNLMHFPISSSQKGSPVAIADKLSASAFPTCSFTDEFIQAISATRDATQFEPPVQPVLDPRTIEAQPDAFQGIWERILEAQTHSLSGQDETFKIESWFLHHATFTRCLESRTTILLTDFSTWQNSLIETWQDKITDRNDFSFALVYPSTEDAANDCIAQLLITQHAQQDLRSIVLSVYDSDDIGERGPKTLAFVVTQQFTLHNLLTYFNLQDDCPPFDRRNLCSLWFGNVPVADDATINAHAGHAYRLIVSRAEAFDISYLITLDEGHMRRILQRAVQTSIHIRPPDPTFLSRDLDPPLSHADIPTGSSRPEWI